MFNSLPTFSINQTYIGHRFYQQCRVVHVTVRFSSWLLLSASGAVCTSHKRETCQQCPLCLPPLQGENNLVVCQKVLSQTCQTSLGRRHVAMLLGILTDVYHVAMLQCMLVSSNWITHRIAHPDPPVWVPKPPMGGPCPPRSSMRVYLPGIHWESIHVEEVFLDDTSGVYLP